MIKILITCKFNKHKYYIKEPIQASLLKLASQELNKLAVECFIGN